MFVHLPYARILPSLLKEINPQEVLSRYKPYAYPKGRLKFASSQFLVSILGTTNTGELVLNQIRLFGIMERGRG